MDPDRIRIFRLIRTQEKSPIRIRTKGPGSETLGGRGVSLLRIRVAYPVFFIYRIRIRLKCLIAYVYNPSGPLECEMHAREN